jgi:hypothetical protein
MNGFPSDVHLVQWGRGVRIMGVRYGDLGYKL